ncbi:hypothetical protein GOBAR_DD22787 [Gossypium barbadense]|nr:hypothetical protein GOBAR_DD22787 [Gossypium barbadense]
MVVDDEPKSMLSWKDKLLGNLASGSKELGTQIWFGDDGKIELMDKDITRLVVNAIPVINFSERVNQILTKNMATTVPYPSVVKAWIKLPRLLGFLYKCRILEEIEGMVGNVTKLDLNTYSRMRSKFVGMVVYINLDKSLTSQVLINGHLYRVEFESLLVVCFGYG